MIQNVIPLHREAVSYAHQRATDERCALTLAELHLACIRSSIFWRDPAHELVTHSDQAAFDAIVTSLKRRP